MKIGTCISNYSAEAQEETKELTDEDIKDLAVGVSTVTGAGIGAFAGPPGMLVGGIVGFIVGGGLGKGIVSLFKKKNKKIPYTYYTKETKEFTYSAPEGHTIVADPTFES